ncbi:helix-turn-helix domain-containing protein [Clostridium hydrogenum]|uniref:helix-turn-helix domain-containing protein n=1 Tax=Clostridium hydrogenum TaxID=2855764 RepID=UPI001F1D4C71|nr:helix-turn-helix transcriptional regulator [Clostridium hydrogenum]
MEGTILSDGEKLKAIRQKYGLRQDEISGEDITRNLISEIETNKANITKKTAEIIIKNLKEIAKKKKLKITETVEYLMENQIVQATKILDNYIEELKTLVISKDGSFIEILKKAENFLIDWDIKDKKLSVYEIAGDYYCNNNEMYKSVVYYEKALALISKVFLDKKLLPLSRKLSIVYNCVGDYKKSIECCEFALNYFDDMPQNDKVIFRYNNALNYKRINNYEKSLQNIKMAEELVSNSDTSKYIKILNNKASCLYEINKKHEALKVFYEISRLIDKNSLEDYLINLTNIVHVCLEVNLMDEAIEKLNVVVNQLVNLNKNGSCISNIYFELGKIYKELEKLQLSEDFYLKALEFSENQKNYILANEILYNLVELYKTLNSIEKMNNIKNKFFSISHRQGKIDNEIMYRLINFYSDNTAIIKELSEFALQINHK